MPPCIIYICSVSYYAQSLKLTPHDDGEVADSMNALTKIKKKKLLKKTSEIVVRYRVVRLSAAFSKTSLYRVGQMLLSGTSSLVVSNANSQQSALATITSRMMGSNLSVDTSPFKGLLMSKDISRQIKNEYLRMSSQVSCKEVM